MRENENKHKAQVCDQQLFVQPINVNGLRDSDLPPLSLSMDGKRRKGGAEGRSSLSWYCITVCCNRRKNKGEMRKKRRRRREGIAAL